MRRYQCLLLCWRRIHTWCERWRAWCTVWSSTSHIQMRFVWDVSETVSPLSITDPLVQEQLCIYVWSIVSMWHWYSWEKSMMYKILIRAGTSCRREVMIVVLRYEVDARYKALSTYGKCGLEVLNRQVRDLMIIMILIQQYWESHKHEKYVNDGMLG